MIVLVVAAVVVPIALLIPILWWAVRRRADLPVTLAAGILQPGETIVLGPDRASYRGGTGPFPRVKGNGVVALTDRRLLFVGLVQRRPGAKVDVDRRDIVGTREATWFRRAASGGQTHLVVQLRSGDEIGFFVPDSARWKAALHDR